MADKRRKKKRPAEPYKWLRDRSVPVSSPDQGHTHNADGLTIDQFAESEYASLEWLPEPDAPDDAPAIHLSVKISNKRVNSRGVATFDYSPTEDSIHPHPLSFDPPLNEFGATDATGFQRYWEKLDYVFGLPDPSDFPLVSVEDQDRTLVERFVRQSWRLAGFGLINKNTKLSVGKPPGGDWRVQLVDPPTDESFVAASAAFRQLHNKGESASFNNAYNALFKVIKTMPEVEQSMVKPIVLEWRAARGKLMNNTLQTLTTMKATNATLDNPISFRNINPDDLIRKFNYGDSLHFTAEGGLVDLLADPHHEAYYTYGALISILGLSHLYFGFAVLLSRALGEVT